MRWLRVPWLRTLIITTILAFVAGCGASEGMPEDFFDRRSQAVEERTVASFLSARDSLNLVDVDVFQPAYVSVEDGSIYLYDGGSSGSVVTFDRDGLSLRRAFEIERGQGPGEIRGAQGFAVSNGQILLADENQHKVVRYDTAGSFVEEFRLPEMPPHRIASLGDGFAVLSTTSSHVFNVFDASGELERGFARTELSQENPIALGGSMTADADHLYYAGYAEPVIKKYALDGEPVFSVSTIDDLPSEVNYMTFGDGETRAWQFTEHALFSSGSIEVAGDRVLVVPLNDIDGNTLRYIDVYSAEDGTYIESYATTGHVREMAVDASGLYTVEHVGDDIYLKAYDNVFQELAGELRPHR